MLKCCGSFFLYTLAMTMHIPFDKDYASPSELVTLLQTRGLAVGDTEKARQYIEHIGYYRLTAYMHPLLSMPKERRKFKPGTSFGQVMRLYRFDKKLRLLLFNEIEKIEIAVRSAVVNMGCRMTGDPFWMTNPAHFASRAKFDKTLGKIDQELGKSREDFIVRFRETYSDPYPPAWILAEILPFGFITNIYANLRDKKLRKRIAQAFGLQAAPFLSWLTIVTLTRNACCHHARVWNKQNTIRPMTPNHAALPWIALPTDAMRIYFDICIIKYFLNAISPGNDMKEKLLSLLNRFPEIDQRAMGFPEGWEGEPVWK